MDYIIASHGAAAIIKDLRITPGPWKAHRVFDLERRAGLPARSGWRLDGPKAFPSMMGKAGKTNPHTKAQRNKSANWRGACR